MEIRTLLCKHNRPIDVDCEKCLHLPSVYKGWFSPKRIQGFRFWIFHRWNDYESRTDVVDGIRILGFEWGK